MSSNENGIKGIKKSGGDGGSEQEGGEAKPRRPPVGKDTGELVAAMSENPRFVGRSQDHLENVAHDIRADKKGFDARRFKARAADPGGPPTVTLRAPTRPTPKVVVDDPQLVVPTQSWGWLWWALAILAIVAYFLAAFATEGVWPGQ